MKASDVVLNEIEAMKKIVDALDGLSTDGVSRVLKWAKACFDDGVFDDTEHEPTP